jgi:hypothetical protein
MAESSSGAVAQLGERLVCNQEATGSIPVSSTNKAVSVMALWQEPDAKDDCSLRHDLGTIKAQLSVGRQCDTVIRILRSNRMLLWRRTLGWK